MVHTFMEGVHPEYLGIMNRYISKVFKEFTEIITEMPVATEEESKKFKEKFRKASKMILEDFNKKLGEYRERNYVNPILDVVSMLPKDELAAMAE